MKNFLNNKWLLLGTTLVVGVLLGWFFSSSSNPSTDSSATQASAHEHDMKDQTWTCSMHPQIRQKEPGQCPLCGMDLIPVETMDMDDLDPNAIRMSETAMQLAQVQSQVVGALVPEKSIRLNGKVQADERKVYAQSAHVSGRVEKLMVNFTGEYVTKGQVLASIYSPELVTAQEELLEAKKMQSTQPQLFQSAKEKLKNWKLTDKQIEQILTSGTPQSTFPILADQSGFVMMKEVNLGDYITSGKSLYTIADFSSVWVLFDVYETDLRWVAKGSPISFTIASVPGTTFKGTISYLDPTIDPKTRVAQARVEVANGNGTLKPEMFASGLVESALALSKSTLVVPKTSVLWTGKRSVVYVKNESESGVSFMLREVTLGPDLGESYVIEAGLTAGEEIATHGTFSIDAAAQLAGKPSMMSREPTGMPAGMPGM